jgi:hypothetical protein
VKFQLVRQGANPKITILGQSVCDAVTCGSPSNLAGIQVRDNVGLLTNRK